MSDDHLMESASDAAIFAAAGSIVAEVERTWQTEDGPPCAFVEWESGWAGVGSEAVPVKARATYVGFVFGETLNRPFGQRSLGHAKMSVLVDWFPDAIRQWVALENAQAIEAHGPNVPPLIPSTHKILWRVRPCVEWNDTAGAWMFYARLTFVPKDVKLIPLET